MTTLVSFKLHSIAKQGYVASYVKLCHFKCFLKCKKQVQESCSQIATLELIGSGKGKAQHDSALQSFSRVMYEKLQNDDYYITLVSVSTSMTDPTLKITLTSSCPEN